MRVKEEEEEDDCVCVLKRFTDVRGDVLSFFISCSLMHISHQACSFTFPSPIPLSPSLSVDTPPHPLSLSLFTRPSVHLFSCCCFFSPVGRFRFVCLCVCR